VIVDGRRGQVWGLSGVAGQRLVIDLMAEDFDAYPFRLAFSSDSTKYHHQ
jgi:hypothetical protein